MRRSSQSGFTLVELVVAMALLGIMMVLLYSGLTFALRTWDAGDANGQRVLDRRIGENFLRRELSEIFPMRWRDPMVLRFAFEGDTHVLRFVSSRPAGVSLGGLSLVSVDVETDPKDRSTNLVMRRALATPDTADFGALDAAEPSILVPDVESVAFSYFGSENDFSDPKWFDQWNLPPRMPSMIRMRIKASDGSYLPDVLVKVMVGEEAGCLQTSMQRGCAPRRS